MNPNQPMKPTDQTEQSPLTIQSTQQIQPTQSGVRRAFNWYKENYFGVAGKWKKRLFTFTPSNSSVAAARIFMSIISIVWLVLAIVPIIITMIQVRSAEDPGSAGMVAFAIFFLAPFWALCITGWLALSPFILFLTGAVQSGWRLQRKEYILLGLSAAHVGLGLYTIYLVPNIIYYYQIWFFPWSL